MQRHALGLKAKVFKTDGFDAQESLIRPPNDWAPASAQPIQMSRAASSNSAQDAPASTSRARIVAPSPTAAPVQLKEGSNKGPKAEDEPKVVQDRAWFKEQKAAGKFPQDLTEEEFFAEFLAKYLAYKTPYDKDGRPLPPEDGGYTDWDRAMLAAWGYKVPTKGDIVDANDGLFAARFDPTEEGEGSSIVAFRGTEFGTLGDVVADLGDDAVGEEQYDRHSDEIRDLLAGAEGEGVRLTGHSLGGALAQRTAAELGDDRDLDITAVTTFQSAGIDEATLQKANELNKKLDVDHYQADSDIVSMCGDGHMKGDFHVADTSAAEGAIFDAHRKYFNFDFEKEGGFEGEKEKGLHGGTLEKTSVDPTDPLVRDLVESMRLVFVQNVGRNAAMLDVGLTFILDVVDVVTDDSLSEIEKVFKVELLKAELMVELAKLTVYDNIQNNLLMLEEIGDGIVHAWNAVAGKHWGVPMDLDKGVAAVQRELESRQAMDEIMEIYADGGHTFQEHKEALRKMEEERDNRLTAEKEGVLEEGNSLCEAAESSGDTGDGSGSAPALLSIQIDTLRMNTITNLALWHEKWIFHCMKTVSNVRSPTSWQQEKMLEEMERLEERNSFVEMTEWYDKTFYFYQEAGGAIFGANDDIKFEWEEDLIVY